MNDEAKGKDSDNSAIRQWSGFQEHRKRSSDRHAWAAAAGEHGREVYRDADNDVAQRQRLTRLQFLAQRDNAAGCNFFLRAMRYISLLPVITSSTSVPCRLQFDVR